MENSHDFSFTNSKTTSITPSAPHSTRQINEFDLSQKINEIRKKIEDSSSKKQANNENQDKRERRNDKKRKHNLMPCQGLSVSPMINQKGKENIVQKEEEFLEKLFHIKQTSRQIPNWQKHVKKILFDETSESKITLNQQKLSENQNSKKGYEKVIQTRVLSQMSFYPKKQPSNSKKTESNSIKTRIDRINMQRKKSKKNSKDHSIVDEKINHIQNKIKEFEEIKKQLDIDFTPFKRNYSQRNFVSDQRRKKVQPKNIKNEKFINSTELEKGNQKQIKKNKSGFVNVGMVQRIKEETSQANQVIRTHTKKNVEQNKINTQKLSQFFHKQVQLDKELKRNLIWFQNLCDRQKWQKLQAEFEFYGVTLPIEKIKKEFSINRQEGLPFFKQKHRNYQILVESYLRSQKYWSFFIKNSSNKKQIEKILMNAEEITHFINARIKKNFSKEDLTLVVRRLTSDKLEIEDIMDNFYD